MTEILENKTSSPFMNSGQAGPSIQRPQAFHAAKGMEIEKQPAWPQVERKIRQFIEAVAAMAQRGVLKEQAGFTPSVATDYPSVMKFMWSSFDGDLGLTAQRALRHALFGYFDSPKDRLRLEELLRYVTPDSPAASKRILLPFPK
jgi:hypothetical protein